MENDAEFWARYRGISSKLRRRFLRKPNLAEAGEQFGHLSKELKQQDCLQYAGFCSLAQARCEQAVMNGLGEAETLTEAARLLLRAEVDNWTLHLPSLQEALQSSCNAFNCAIKVYTELRQTTMAASLCLDLAQSLKLMGKDGEACVFFRRAAELQYETPFASLHSLGQAASCCLLTHDYEGALTLYTTMQQVAEEKAPRLPGNNAPVGAFQDIIASNEISRVLLLMLVQPPPQHLAPEHARTLENYAWSALDSPGHARSQCLPEELFILLQSVVMACQEKDVEALRVLQKELWPLLDKNQNDILHLLICVKENPSSRHP
uniref:40-kDa huntingtin-associated protein-like n=1 Tax=Myxine glutinosa TaxID=7769 RepID=UPI003590099C